MCHGHTTNPKKTGAKESQLTDTRKNCDQDRAPNKLVSESESDEPRDSYLSDYEDDDESESE